MNRLWNCVSPLEVHPGGAVADAVGELGDLRRVEGSGEEAYLGGFSDVPAEGTV